MQEKDKVMKDFESYPDVAADIINALVYDGDACPVMELVLYWGRNHWERARSMRQKFRERVLEEKAWEYIDDIQLHVWECSHLGTDIRKSFISDMRIVLDYLAEGSSYRSERKVVHKAALMNMIKVLSGDLDLDSTDSFMKEMNISEEGEITVCELFDQYERRGIEQGIVRGREQTIRSFINKLHLTVEQALEAADIPEEEWSKYKEKLTEPVMR